MNNSVSQTLNQSEAQWGASAKGWDRVGEKLSGPKDRERNWITQTMEMFTLREP